jgi:hypothetical protein
VKPSEPPHYTPPPAKEDANQPKWNVSVKPRLVVLLGEGPPGLPLVGYGGGVSIGRALATVRRIRFGLAAAFAYDRVSRSDDLGHDQSLSHASFAIAAQFDAIFNRLRPFLTLGGGFSVGTWQDTFGPDFVSDVSVAGLVQIGAGLAVRVYDQLELGLRSEVDFTFSPTQVGAPPVNVYQPGLFALSLDIGFRF